MRYNYTGIYMSILQQDHIPGCAAHTLIFGFIDALG